MNLAVLPIVLWKTTEPMRRAQSKRFATARAGDTTTIDEVVRRLESAEERDRIPALEDARHALDHAERFVPQLTSFLGSVHPEERSCACFALGGLVPHSLDALFAALSHSDARAHRSRGMNREVDAAVRHRRAADRARRSGRMAAR